MRFIKPLDEAMILKVSSQYDLIVTIEENAIAGGAGSAVSEFLNQKGIVIPLLQLGLPDRFEPHAKHTEMLSASQLDADGILQQIESRMTLLHFSGHTQKTYTEKTPATST